MKDKPVNLFKKIKGNILLSVFIYAVSFIFLLFIMSFLKINFRQWVYITSFIIVGLGGIIGIFQLLFKIKKKGLKILLSLVFIIGLIVISPYVLLISAFAYQPEHIVEKDDKKMVAYVNGFMDTYVTYYDYKGFLLVGNQLRIKEYYGQGGFDPIKNKYGYTYDIVSTTYYDNNGKEIKSETENEHKINNIQIDNNISTSNSNSSETGKMQKWNGNIGYKDGKFYINYYSSNPIEIPIYVDDIRTTFSSENTMTKSDNRIAFAFKKDNKVNIVYSIDNGQSWETSYIDKNYDVYYFKNINKNVSYLVLISNAAMRDIETYIYKSSDGFKTWQEVSKQNMKIDSKVNFESENIGYFVITSVDNTNNEYFATTDGGKTFNKIISETKAADIADKEAKKDKYQYQSWKSNFQSRWEGKASNEIASKLLYEMDNITKLYHWNEEWKISDYKNKLMWEIWLNDENDPLTNLYIYIDAYNGNIIGAGKASD